MDAHNCSRGLAVVAVTLALEVPFLAGQPSIGALLVAGVLALIGVSWLRRVRSQERILIEFTKD